MTEKNMTWVPPQLIVIGRYRPEENVLSGCKWTISAQFTGPDQIQYGKCDGPILCSTCSSIAPS